MPALSRAEREQRQAEESVLRERMRSATRAPKKMVSGGCRLHPEFLVDVTAGQIPPPHAGLCPYCRDEELARREPEQGKPRRIDPGSAGDKLDLRYELFREKHGIQGIEPRSYAEEEALRRIDSLRETEARRDEPRSEGVLVSARAVGGRWIETWRVGNRYVQIGPG